MFRENSTPNYDFDNIDYRRSIVSVELQGPCGNAYQDYSLLGVTDGVDISYNPADYL
jgi:hypothetical protein